MTTSFQMTRFLIRFRFPPPSPPSIVRRCLSKSSTHHHHSLLLVPFFSHPSQEISPFPTNLVDDHLWPLTINLTSAVSPSCKMEETSVDDDDDIGSSENNSLGFDEIDEMRWSRKLFYKIDRDSKEYEECSVRFHKIKSARNKEKKKKNKVSSKLGLNSGCRGGGEKLGMIEEYSRVKNWMSGDQRNGVSCRSDAMGSGGRMKESLKLGLYSDDGVRRNVSKYKENSDVKMVIKGKENSGLDCSGSQGFVHERKIEDLISVLDSEQKYADSMPVLGNSIEGNLSSSWSNHEDIGFPNVDCNSIVMIGGGKKERISTFNQLTDPYHLPFCLDIYITKGSVRACIVHRISSKVVVVAHSISKDMKFDLKSRKDVPACAAVGSALAQRAIADDIHNVVYTPRKGDKIEGKLQVVLQAIIDYGVEVKVKLKERKIFKRGKDSKLEGEFPLDVLQRNSGVMEKPSSNRKCPSNILPAKKQ